MLSPTSLQSVQTTCDFQHIRRNRNLPPPNPQHARFHWPTHFEGSRLHPMLNSEYELLYQNSNPERISTFHSAGRQVIFRCLNQKTDLAHSFATLLQTSGYEISHSASHRENWLSFYTQINEHSLHIREQIPYDNHLRIQTSSQLTKEVEPQEQGSYLAVTVITPIRASERH